MSELKLFTSIITAKPGDTICYNKNLYEVVDVQETLLPNDVDEHRHLILTLKELVTGYISDIIDEVARF